MSFLSQVDPQISQAIAAEAKRQKNTINLIASENYASKAVLEAQGSLLTDKYAEGYPGNRHYAGCEDVDIVETLAIERAKELFHAEHANVQPHAGAQTNMAAYFALMEYGDTALGMALPHGGHMTHGEKFSFSGKAYNFLSYGLNQETERIDYKEVQKIALSCRPKVIVAGASAYPRIIDYENFRYIADLVGAKLVVDMAHIAGLVAVGLHPSPVPYADVVTSTTHKTLRGPRGGFILCKKELAKAIDTAVFPRMQGGPMMHVIAAKAVCFHEALQPDFYEYQKAILSNATMLANELKKLGLRLVTDGTDNHIVFVDLSSTGVTGRQAEETLCSIGVVANHNAIPFDTRPTRTASGVRLGTPAVTTRGFRGEEMKRIAAIIVKTIHNVGNETVLNELSQEVLQMCQRFPVPGLEN